MKAKIYSLMHIVTAIINQFLAVKKFFSRRVVVVGGGYIAVELSSVLSALGSDVHLLVRKSRVLWNFDHTLSECLTESIDKGPTKLYKNIEVSFFYHIDLYSK